MHWTYVGLMIFFFSGSIVQRSKDVFEIRELNYLLSSFIWIFQEKVTQEQFTQISKETRDLLLQNIPDMLVNLVGQQSATNGTIKTFETLQNQTLNKHLFYDILDLWLREIVPEIFHVEPSPHQC